MRPIARADVRGINLEDIKSPECFYIEDTLKKTMNIPVFHDDQHGTAIISGAGLLNALELAKKNIATIKLVCCGAGAAAIACCRFYMLLGVKKENIWMCDRKGLFIWDVLISMISRRNLRTARNVNLSVMSCTTPMCSSDFRPRIGDEGNDCCDGERSDCVRNGKSGS